MLERYIRTGDGKDYVDVDCVREALGIVDEHVDIFGEIKKLREERDQLKEKCDKLKARANATYGVSCGYSGDKAPAFLCDVISYSWSFGAIDDAPFPSNSIRVELNLTPTANYKGTFDLEDLKKYIQEYGSEKKLSDFEVFCRLVDNCIDELCDKYNVVRPLDSETTRGRLDYIFGVLDEYRTLANNNFNKAEGFRKEKRAVEDSLAELRAKVREIYRSVFCDCRWEVGYSHCSALNDINEEYKRVKYFFKEKNDELKEAKKEYSRYRLAVNSLLDIPKGMRDDINAIERAFTSSKNEYKSLKEFRNDVCEILDIPSSMADDQEQILKEIHDFADRYYELKDFRADICEVLGIDTDKLFGFPQQNDKYILERVEKLKKTPNRDAFRYAICNALNMPTTSIDGNIIGRIHMKQDCHNKLCKDYIELRKVIWEAMDRKPETLPEENARLVGEVTELARGEKLLIEFRDAVAKAIGMNYPTTNQVILNNVQYIYKDREDAYKMVAKLNDHITAVEKVKEKLQKDYDELGEAYSSVLKWNNSYAEVRRLLGISADADADEMVDALDQLVVDREKCKRRYENWYSRYESEHTRANGEHKKAEKLQKEVRGWTKRCDSLEQALNAKSNEEVGLSAFKNECRKLKEEKAKVIAALGQDIWDDCLK